MVSAASTWKEAEESVLSCTAQIMNQAVKVLRSKAITDNSYTFESKTIAGSSAGKHFRHVLDHLRILLDAIEEWQSSTTGLAARCRSNASATLSEASGSESNKMLRVDYDSRINSKVAHLETCVAASLEEFERTVERLCRIFEGSNGRLYGQALRLCATTPLVVEMESTVGRELWFCGLHAIHHYALARVILVKELGLEGIEEQFGVAPSTLVHREWRKASNRTDVAHHVLAPGLKDELTRNSSSKSSRSSRTASCSSRHWKGHSQTSRHRQVRCKL
ncbi:hypothetical protein NDA11_001637 [Ustilago hordei]|uniref:DinB-like domain-containing protein n=1 Tax=Ustilago hordei TaxID=120017 RepID=I2FP89_USTHO|nr:uncharacterized protein UHO2_06733 [Ustilago hordei]KAJ1037961.1 hypothetical protein NDA10_005465 [Ustilago hordei]KAJ1584327.1 hypothetical protein NDA12_002951 [Ustilago hordei]KAJ1593568.1 hypothetical protein NDA15_007071 [Ustilago hordei]KAJ1595542.1 hypothetical protein NDA11_001637 [Ustilago hordei]CCF48732.1 uncharacterized protein UHOR_08736 [Ustilago hordei]